MKVIKRHQKAAQRTFASNASEDFKNRYRALKIEKKLNRGTKEMQATAGPLSALAEGGTRVSSDDVKALLGN
jgi:phosphoribosylformylglycinamidine (FGAM) synthase-like amidotransferase family enzyme